jgi:fucose permease
MLAIAFLIAFLLYLGLSVAISKWVAAIANYKGLSRKKWGLATFVLMMGLIFWDWLPMEILIRVDAAGWSRAKVIPA